MNLDDVFAKSLLSFDFFGLINEIIHYLQSAGLLDKWHNDENQAKITAMWKQSLNLHVVMDTSNGESVEPTVPTIIWCGWIASSILFICEIIWKKVDHNVKVQIERLRKTFRSTKIGRKSKFNFF